MVRCNKRRITVEGLESEEEEKEVGKPALGSEGLIGLGVVRSSKRRITVEGLESEEEDKEGR